MGEIVGVVDVVDECFFEDVGVVDVVEEVGFDCGVD